MRTSYVRHGVYTCYGGGLGLLMLSPPFVHLPPVRKGVANTSDDVAGLPQLTMYPTLGV